MARELARVDSFYGVGGITRSLVLRDAPASGAPFAPNWVVPPGDTIADVLEERGWTQAELAQRLGYADEHVSQIINGDAAITEDVAARLACVLGSTAGFWLRKEATYRGRLERRQCK